MEQARIERRTTLALDLDDTWRRLVDDFGDWFGTDASLDPTEGGVVESGGRRGHVTVLEPARALAWEWSRDGDPGWTEVRIDLDESSGRTEVVVTETLHEWEQETYGAIDGGGPGAFGVLAMSA